MSHSSSLSEVTPNTTNQNCGLDHFLPLLRWTNRCSRDVFSRHSLGFRASVSHRSCDTPSGPARDRASLPCVDTFTDSRFGKQRATDRGRLAASQGTVLACLAAKEKTVVRQLMTKWHDRGCGSSDRLARANTGHARCGHITPLIGGGRRFPANAKPASGDRNTLHIKDLRATLSPRPWPL